jgi:hypothetical protein
MLTSAGNIETKTAPITGPRVVLMPPISTMTKMLSDTAQSNCPGETTPRNENSHPAPPAIAAEAPKTPILMSDVRAPAASAKRSASRIDRSTG